MDRRSKNMTPNGKIYGRWMVMPGVWTLTNRWSNFQHLLIGDERAMLIDTGYGDGDFPEVIEQITDKPVVVVSTHGHFDHTGGNGFWPEAWMAEPATANAREAFTPELAAQAAALPYPDYKINIVKDGDVIDLGNREVEIIAIPAHNEGSIALLDKKRRLLFCGDELEGGQVLMFVRLQNTLSRKDVVAMHRANMLKLKARRGEYDFICPAHNGCMLYPDRYLDDFIALADEILADTAVPMPDSGGFGFPPDPGAVVSPFSAYAPVERYEHGEATFVFQK